MGPHDGASGSEARRGEGPAARSGRPGRAVLAAVLALPFGATALLFGGASEVATPRTRPRVGASDARARGETAAGARVAVAATSVRAGPDARGRAASPRSGPTSEARILARASGAPSREVLEALRRAAPQESRRIQLALLEEPALPGDAGFLEGLLALAKDADAEVEARVVALDLVARCPQAAEDAIASVRALAVARGEAPLVGTAAVLCLRSLAQGRPELEGSARAALLDALEQAPTVEARAAGLEGLSLATAPDEEVARVASWLGDGDAFVRAGVARALGTSPARLAERVASALEPARARETDARVRASLTAAAAALAPESAALAGPR